jgi:hypothetical protein
MRGYDSRLCMFSYYQIHPSSINKTDGGSSTENGVTSNVKSNTMTWHPRLALNLLSGLKIFQKAQPKTPPNGLISSFLVLLTTIGIITIFAGIKCSHILDSKTSTASKGDKTFMPSSKGVADCILLSSKGDDTDSDTVLYSTEDFERDIKYPLASLHRFTSSFADGDSEKLNTQIHFNMGSVFFVCNNSTTGHICNNVRKFVPRTRDSLTGTTLE